VFTDGEIAEADHHVALAKVEIKCPTCNSRQSIDFRDLVNNGVEEEGE